MQYITVLKVEVNAQLMVVGGMLIQAYNTGTIWYSIVMSVGEYH